MVAAAPLSADWYDVTHAEPCRICGKPDWCSRLIAGSVVVADICRREQREGAHVYTEKSGNEAYFYARDPNAPRTYAEPAWRVPLAPPELRDRVYGALLEGAPLSKLHYAELREARAFSDDEIALLGYASHQPAAVNLSAVCSAAETIAPLGVPGIFRRDGAKDLRVAGPEGLAIPVRDVARRIVGVRIRQALEGGAKRYTWLSSPLDSIGAGASAVPHVPLHRAGAHEEIRVTEGELKADFATLRTGVLTLSVPGVSVQAGLVQVAHALGARRIRLALDADARRNRYVAGPLQRLAELLAAAGFGLAVEVWPEDAGKGIDDVIRNGHADTIEIHDGIEAWQRIAEIAASAKARPSPGVGAREEIAEHLKRVETDPALAFDDGFVAAVAKLDPTSVEFQQLRNRLKRTGVVLAPWDAKVHAARRKGPVPTNKPTPVAFERGDHVELAIRMLDVVRAGSELVADEGALYRYASSSGLWAVIVEAEQSTIVQGFAGAKVGRDEKELLIRATDVAGAVRLARHRVERAGFFNDAPSGIAFSNGFATVDKEGVLLLPHAPERRARAGFSFAYDDAQKPLRWLACLREIFRDDADAVERIAVLQEFAGACLVGIATRYALVLVLLGDGSDGKSTIGKVLSGVMPEGTVSAIAPQLWGSEYRRAQLRGVLLNVVAELPEADILDAEAFKAIVAGDPTDAREIREAPFMLRPRAGHLFSTNRLPGTRDLSHGFWRRLCVLKCSRRFTQEEADTEMAERLLADERPAIITWALEGAVRLLARGRYTLPASSAEHTEAWRKSADVVGLFIEDRIERVTDGAESVPPMQLYRAFRSWTEERGFKALNVQKFGQRMAAHGLESEKGSKGARGYPVRFRHGGDQ